MIEFKNVSKVYGQTVALDGLNLTIESGKIIGLIGHNGAGKSTTIKSLVSVINPTSGEIFVDGQELSANRLAIKEKIGYVADSPGISCFFLWHDSRRSRKSSCLFIRFI